MRRLSGGFIALLVALAALVVLAPAASSAPAQAQEACFPGDPVDYPPSAPGAEIELRLSLVGGHFNPGADGSITVTGAIPGLSYCAIIFSTPIVLQPKASDGGNISYIRFAVPADFQLNAMHHMDLYRQRKLVGVFDFCVKANGDIGPTSACGAADKGKLPRTGADNLLVLLRWGALALGLGAFFMYLRRRREQSHRTA